MKNTDDLVTKEDLEFQTQQLKSYLDLSINKKFTNFYFSILKFFSIVAIIALFIIFIKLS